MDINEAVTRAKELLDEVVDPNRSRAAYDLQYELGLCMDDINEHLSAQDAKEFG